MNSSSSISPRDSDWVNDIAYGTSNVNSSDKAIAVDIGLSRSEITLPSDYNINYDLGFPPPDNSKLGGRILNLLYYRRLYYSGGYDEKISVPEINIRCKKSGFYTFVVGEHRVTGNFKYIYNFTFNGSDPSKYLVRKYMNEAWDTYQYTYNIFFKTGDIFKIKHSGGTFNNSEGHSQPLEDNSIRCLTESNSGKINSLYNLTAVAWTFETQHDENGVVTFVPVNKSSNFEAYA